MSQKPPLKMPRVIELATFIAKHEGLSVPELIDEGFSKPSVYSLLAALEERGIIEVRPGKTDNERGATFRRTFYITPLGDSFVSHALEMQKLVA